jgi:dCTP diphosphatase
MDASSMQARLRTFAGERDWDQYHSPQNLSMAPAFEASELMELFQWVGIIDTGCLLESQRGGPLCLECL